jgi:hypothetical protein
VGKNHDGSKLDRQEARDEERIEREPDPQPQNESDPVANKEKAPMRTMKDCQDTNHDPYFHSGQVIKEGDAWWWAWRSISDPTKVGIVDWGEVDYIVPTETPGVVNVFVRFGQERREYQGIDFLRENEEAPTPGDPWPLGQ